MARAVSAESNARREARRDAKLALFAARGAALDERKARKEAPAERKARIAAAREACGETRARLREAQKARRDEARHALSLVQKAEREQLAAECKADRERIKVEVGSRVEGLRALREAARAEAARTRALAARHTSEAQRHAMSRMREPFEEAIDAAGRDLEGVADAVVLWAWGKFKNTRDARRLYSETKAKLLAEHRGGGTPDAIGDAIAVRFLEGASEQRDELERAFYTATEGHDFGAEQARHEAQQAREAAPLDEPAPFVPEPMERESRESLDRWSASRFEEPARAAWEADALAESPPPPDAPSAATVAYWARQVEQFLRTLRHPRDGTQLSHAREQIALWTGTLDDTEWSAVVDALKARGATEIFAGGGIYDDDPEPWIRFVGRPEKGRAGAWKYDEQIERGEAIRRADYVVELLRYAHGAAPLYYLREMLDRRFGQLNAKEWTDTLGVLEAEHVAHVEPVRDSKSDDPRARVIGLVKLVPPDGSRYAERHAAPF